MDGAAVELKDIVYDVLLGTGIVVSLNDDASFVVAFGKRHVTYQEGGYMAGVKRLYWRNPIMYTPKKFEGNKQELIKDVVELLRARLGDD